MLSWSKKVGEDGAVETDPERASFSQFGDAGTLNEYSELGDDCRELDDEADGGRIVLLPTSRPSTLSLLIEQRKELSQNAGSIIGRAMGVEYIRTSVASVCYKQSGEKERA